MKNALFASHERAKMKKSAADPRFFRYTPFIHKLPTSFAIGRTNFGDIFNPRQPENLGWKEAGLQLAGAGSHVRSDQPVDEVCTWVGPERAMQAAK